jgi:hypothetical protein
MPADGARRTLADVLGPKVMAERDASTRTRKRPFGHADLLRLAVVLPTDYTDYGGTVKRWANDGESYPDCSCDCVWAAWLGFELGLDWCVCARPDGVRAGMLTFEHAAGYGERCYEDARDYKERRKREAGT